MTSLLKKEKDKNVNAEVERDPYIRRASEIVGPMGMSPHDAAKLQPGKSIARTYEYIADVEEREYPKSSEFILAQGAAVALDENHQLSHFWPGRVKNFVGFLLGSNETRAAVKTRGSIVLKLEGASLTKIGKPVFCSGPNSFSLQRSAGAAEIGAIRHVQGDGMASVAFRRFDSDKPLSLDIKNI